MTLAAQFKSRLVVHLPFDLAAHPDSFAGGDDAVRTDGQGKAKSATIGLPHEKLHIHLLPSNSGMRGWWLQPQDGLTAKQKKGETTTLGTELVSVNKNFSNKTAKQQPKRKEQRK